MRITGTTAQIRSILDAQTGASVIVTIVYEIDAITNTVARAAVIGNTAQEVVFDWPTETDRPTEAALLAIYPNAKPVTSLAAG